MERITRAKKVTITDIAHSVGVSKNSVSLALRGMAGVGPDLRRRIIDTAIQMGYMDDQPIESPEDTCIVVILPNYLHSDAFFYSDVLWAIDDDIKSRGACAIRIGITKDMEEARELPVMPKGLHVIGIIVVGIFDIEYVKRLQELGLPFLSVDIPYQNFPCIGSSNIMGGLAATNHLIDLGHKEIGFIGPIYSATSVYERWCGFKLGMSEAGLSYENGYNILGEQTFRLFDSEDALEPYVSRMGKLPTAWFCAGDCIAIAMIHLLTKRGFCIPGDVSIMGFDDILAAQMVIPCLTTIRTDRQLMGKLAVNYFFEIRRNKDMATVSKTVPYELIVRDSVAAATI